jgi:hypothetical protein
MTILDSILSIDDTKQALSVDSSEQENKYKIHIEEKLKQILYA